MAFTPFPPSPVPAGTLTAKGDVLTHDGTGDVVLPYSANDGDVLVVDTAEASGVKWETPSGGGGVNYVMGATQSPNTFSTTNTSGATITGLSVTITTTGGPVRLSLTGASGTTGLWAPTAQVYVTGTTNFHTLQFMRAGNSVAGPRIAGGNVFISDVMVVDTTVPAGTHTYTIRAAPGSGTMFVTNMRLDAQEMA